MTKCSIFSFPHQSLDLVFKLAEPIDNSCVICSTIGYSRGQSRHFLIWSTKSPITTLVCKVPIWVVNSILIMILKSLHNILIMLSWLHVFFIDVKKGKMSYINNQNAYGVQKPNNLHSFSSFLMKPIWWICSCTIICVCFVLKNQS